MADGYLALVLHAHLPFVRHPEHEHFLEEKWLYEAISETYIPLLDIFDRLHRDGVPFRLTISISPTLAEMLEDPLLQNRYIRHLERLIELSRSEMDRNVGAPTLLQLAEMYHVRFRHCLETFTGRYQKRLLQGFIDFQSQGYLELITSGATHGFLPLLQVVPEAVKAQIEIAVLTHRKNLCKHPRGIWLPECGYYPGVEKYLEDFGLRYFFIETHGLLYSENKPRYGVYSPITCPNQIVAFARDPESSKAVWSSEEGYPGDPVYRDFYRDIGYDLPLDDIQPFLHDGGIRVNTGIKYYAVTGRTEEKRIYNRQRAVHKAGEHAGAFLQSRLRQIDRLRSSMDRPPLIVSPYDAELFGHWWFEGPEWIEQLIRKIALVSERIKLITPSDYLTECNDYQISQPCLSSWGNKGYAEVWLEGSNDWIYRHLHKASERMVELCRRFPNERGIRARALNQASRELLLGQASDWAFIMKTGTMVPYAVRRTKEHISNFNRIYASIMSNEIDQEWLMKIEARNNIFSSIDYRVFTR